MNWKKIAFGTLNIVLGVYLVLAMTAFNKPDAGRVCRDIRINIEKSVVEGFLSEADIKFMLNHDAISPIGQSMEKINLRVMEDILESKELIEQVLEKDKNHKNAKIYLQRINKQLMAQQATEESVDKNIPVAAQYDMNTFAVIIGNEKYAEDVTVPYAAHDAQVFKEYVQRTFGVPEKQINYIENAGLNKIRTAVRWLAKAMEVTNGKGRAIFYYAGHGIPDEASKAAYLLPVDGMSGDIESAYPLSKLYQELGAIPSERITVFLDACFNGGKRDGDMLASARGVAIKAKTAAPHGNMVVFTAAQGDETAFALNSQQHGLFTYYILKKLQDSKGNVSLGELGDYLTKEVKRESFEKNNKIQTPVVNASAALADSWRTMKLK